ncbi:hypothetical protein B7O87_03140 [Cylindrospermopsis raciborskii CENA303]|uniref:Uma2 family endonuclease n=1 Tax=Cylindrospermopsis raciborskii CENA303 TaxID=1170769 RepID=A0A1X4GB75_9CYAN|nr:hypothetical protein B7O87_03140 [Cylindrospermopsis raciborskii CENA303]
MYDLPSENPEEPGLPDEFHNFQPQLLRETCQSSVYPRAEREKQRAEQERLAKEQAEAMTIQERQQRELAEAIVIQEREKKEKLAARLRSLGINPDDI